MRAWCLAVVIASLSVSREARGWCRARSGPGQPDPSVCPSAGAPLRWSVRCAGYGVDTSRLPDGVDGDALRSIAARAADAWRMAACDRSSGAGPSFALHALGGTARPVGFLLGERNENTVAFRARWGDDAVHRPGASAITVVSYDTSSGELFDADTELNLRAPENPSGFRFTSSGEPMAVDLETVLLHELGHVGGLAHSADTDAVMWPSAGATFPQRALSDDDARGACAAHPPMPEVVCDPRVAGAPRRPPPSSGGCAVSDARGAGGTVFATLLAALAGWTRRGQRKCTRRVHP